MKPIVFQIDTTMTHQIAVFGLDSQLTFANPNSNSALLRIPCSGLKIQSHSSAATENEMTVGLNRVAR